MVAEPCVLLLWGCEGPQARTSAHRVPAQKVAVKAGWTLTAECADGGALRSEVTTLRPEGGVGGWVLLLPGDIAARTH